MPSRDWWHRATRWTVAGLALCTALVMATEQHTLCSGDLEPCPHTLVTDVGALPFVLIVVILGLQAAGYRRGPLARVLTGLASFLTSLMTKFVIVGGTRFEGSGSDGAAAVALVLTVATLIQMCIDPILADQRQPPALSHPPLPRAVVVSR